MLALVAFLFLMPTATARDPLKESGLNIHLDVDIDIGSPVECLRPYVMGDSDGRGLGSADVPSSIYGEDRKIGIVLLGASLSTDDGYYGVRFACEDG